MFNLRPSSAAKGLRGWYCIETFLPYFNPQVALSNSTTSHCAYQIESVRPTRHQKYYSGLHSMRTSVVYTGWSLIASSSSYTPPNTKYNYLILFRNPRKSPFMAMIEAKETGAAAKRARRRSRRKVNRSSVEIVGPDNKPVIKGSKDGSSGRTALSKDSERSNGMPGFGIRAEHSPITRMSALFAILQADQLHV